MRKRRTTMWALSVAFLFTLWLAQAAVGEPAKRLCISEMRSETLFAHLLFLLLAAGAACFGLAAHRMRHRVSATLGALIATCLLGAWVTPATSAVHGVLANVPLALLVLYAPLMLAYGGHPLWAVAVLAVVLVWNGLFLLAVFLLPAVHGYPEFQKANAILFFGLLNFFYYRVLPSTPPLFDSGHTPS